MSGLTYNIGSDKIYGCLCVRLPICTPTDYLPMRLAAGLVCQCLYMMFDYVSPCVYIYISER